MDNTSFGAKSQDSVSTIGSATSLADARSAQNDGSEASAYRRNRWTFGIGTIGRDMLYTLISMFLIAYLTNVADLPDATLAWVVGVWVALRIFDAVTDPLMGMIVDNTRSRWGKHKPWILFGALTSGLITLLFFANLGLTGAAYVVTFAVIFFFWSATYSLNDIAYWSYVPALSQDQKQRENIGAKARIFALIGTFFVVAGIVPITGALGGDDEQRGYFLFAIIIVVVLWLGQSVTLLGVREPKLTSERETTSFREFVTAIVKNDQLLWIAIAMGLFMIGYITTTSFGLFYFQYVYGNESMFMVFSVVLGVSQIASLLVFPYVAKRLPRRTVYLLATALVVAGYVLFFFAPTDTMIVIGIAGVLIFVGQAAIQLLMLLCLADTVDYGHWKLGKRNDSVTFSLQPFIYKAGGAIGTGIVGFTAIITGLNDATYGEDLLTGGDLTVFKLAMFGLPLVFIAVGYLIYHFKYRIDETKYAQIHADLLSRGEIQQTS
ncbi:MAG: glycoside-pentoside-hexuronide (GPH):cation symporter [Promicromonosporaceae bacterium]|nr:glycoside-pentoside-hexuronide (GPH):cation symporter [Promicromonosporaceae bacterium]